MVSSAGERENGGGAWQQLKGPLMVDSLLTVPDQEELLSKVYAHAVAARAGYVTAVYELDRDGIDIRIQAGGDMRPALELQLKATINLGEPGTDGCFRFQLKIRNYNLLRIPTQTPRLLVVLDLPKEPDQWMTLTADELVLRRRSYWLNLQGCEETTNSSYVTVRIPATNVFDVGRLRDLMDQSRNGRIL